MLHDGAQLYINIKKDALLGVQKEKEEEEEDIFIFFFLFSFSFPPRLLHTHRQTHFKYLTVPQPERKKEKKLKSSDSLLGERGGRTTRVRFMRSQMKKTRQTFSLVRFPSPMN